jgi:hypothetical protein
MNTVLPKEIAMDSTNWTKAAQYFEYSKAANSCVLAELCFHRTVGNRCGGVSVQNHQSRASAVSTLS